MDFKFDEVYTYGVQEIAQNIRTKVKRYNFLTQHFFNKVGNISDREGVLVRVLDDSNTVAEQSPRYTEGIYNKGDGSFKFVYMATPYFHNWKDINPAMLTQIVKVEDPARPFTPKERAIYLAAEKMDELAAEQDKALEYQVFELLSTGKIVVEGYGKQGLNLPSNLFVDATSDKISSATDTIAWLTKYAKRAQSTGNLNIDSIVMSEDVFTVLYGDSVIRDIMNNRRILGNDFTFTGEDSRGVSYYGHLALPGVGSIALYGYNPQTNANKIFPTGSILFGAEGMGSVNYGAVLRNDGVGGLSIPVASKVMESVYTTSNGIPSALRVDRQTSPLCSPDQLGGWCYVKNAV